MKPDRWAFNLCMIVLCVVATAGFNMGSRRQVDRPVAAAGAAESRAASPGRLLRTLRPATGIRNAWIASTGVL
jgi:hypothetical protein